MTLLAVTSAALLPSLYRKSSVELRSDACTGNPVISVPSRRKQATASLRYRRHYEDSRTTGAEVQMSCIHQSWTVWRVRGDDRYLSHRYFHSIRRGCESDCLMQTTLQARAIKARLELTVFALSELRGGASSFLNENSVLCERGSAQHANIPRFTGLATVIRCDSRRGTRPMSLLSNTVECHRSA